MTNILQMRLNKQSPLFPIEIRGGRRLASTRDAQNGTGIFTFHAERQLDSCANEVNMSVKHGASGLMKTTPLK